MRLEILQTYMNQEFGCKTPGPVTCSCRNSFLTATVFKLCNIRIQHGYSYIKVHQILRETILWSFSYTIYKIGSPNNSMLYQNQLLNEVYYKGSVLYFYHVYIQAFS